VEFSSSLSTVYTKWCAQSFPPIFALFAIFDRNFAKIVALPGNENENYVVHLKDQPIDNKALKTASKLTHKSLHNICLNYVHYTGRQTKRDIQKTPIFAPTAGARSSISPFFAC